MEPVWLKEVLFAGQTANGFKLGTALSLGWFWARINGCRLVYRGGSIETIDFNNILVVADVSAEEINLPIYLSHQPGRVYFYIVRCANSCGQIEQTLRAVVKATIDDEGRIEKPTPNGVFGLTGGQRRDGEVEIVWQYNPIGQASGPQEMKIYSDAGTGEIDYQQPLATTPYKGRRFYRYRLEPNGESRFQIAVRAVDVRGNEHADMKKVEVEVQNRNIEAIEILDASNV
jgi:hypothetical protein